MPNPCTPPDGRARRGAVLLPVLPALLALLALLAGCGGGSSDDDDDDDDGPPASAPYRVGGVLGGLGAGTALVLQNNGGDDLRLTASGSFGFATALAAGAAYAVTVKTQPPGQRCTVERGSGTVRAEVGDVAVLCAAAGGGTGPGDEQVVALDMALIAGDWVQDACVAAGGGRSARNLVRLGASAAARVGYATGVVLYEGPDCAGSGSLAGVTPIGQAAFDEGRANAAVTAYWGLWTTVTTSTRAVFARKGVRLCVLGDASPSILPSVVLVEASADLSIRGNNCYQRR